MLPWSRLTSSIASSTALWLWLWRCHTRPPYLANAELDALLPALFERVISRLLRPLETGSRKVIPSLVHSNLWCGNAGIIGDDTEEGIVYDPASFWAHNECMELTEPTPFLDRTGDSKLVEAEHSDELGNWRPERSNFTRLYFQMYHLHILKSEPKEDYED